MREADILLHVADISHPGLEEQLLVVKQTLTDIRASDKPTVMIFNKIDAYQPIYKDADDLTPPSHENLTLEELKKTWIARENAPSVFISAATGENLDALRDLIHSEVRRILVTRYPEAQNQANSL